MSNRSKKCRKIGLIGDILSGREKRTFDGKTWENLHSSDANDKSEYLQSRDEGNGRGA
jgi:hypothetical protein